MNRISKLLIVILFLIVGCTKDNNPVSNTSAQLTFVIDSLKYSAKVKMDTLVSSLATFISFRVIFHFEGKPGSVEELSMVLGSVGGTLFLEPVYPIPIGIEKELGWDYRDSSTYLGQDSILMKIELTGRFWDHKDSTIITYGSFLKRDSVWVKLQR